MPEKKEAEKRATERRRFVASCEVSHEHYKQPVGEPQFQKGSWVDIYIAIGWQPEGVKGEGKS